MGAVARFNSGVCARPDVATGDRRGSEDNAMTPSLLETPSRRRTIPLSGYRILRCPECGKICPVLKCVEFPVCPKCGVRL